MLKEKVSVKSKVEAVLFSTGHRMNLDSICKLCRSNREDVVMALQELKKEYDDKQSSLMLVEEGDIWKFTVRDHFIPMVRKIVTETELTKSVMETLAVIAFKYPVLQSDLIKMRTNKAYDHLVELEKSGYITRQKHGRTNLIKLTDRFFKYFDLTEEKLKDRLQDFDSIARAIKEKEQEVIKIKEEQRSRAEELKKEDEKIKKEIESLDKSGEDFEVPLETYGTKSPAVISGDFVQMDNLIVEKEKIGDLEVVEEAQKSKSHKKHKEERIEQVIEASAPAQPELGITQQTREKEEINVNEKPLDETIKQKRKSEGIKFTPEMEAKANQIVENILHPEKENKEDKKEV